MEAPTPPGRWEADLNGFFATLAQEDQTFIDNLKRQTDFYHNTARPALETAAAALHPHARTCETGFDDGRVYLIVRHLEGPVEFQYAVVAEVRIEAVLPYVHCWFEENKLAKAIAAEQGQPEAPPKDDKGGEKEDKGDDSKEEGDDDKAEGGDEKQDDKEPTRTKTIELLSTWRDDRQLESVTQEEILTDFLNHYKEAVAQARTHLHTTPR
ncbi:hypothetical protein [Hymenobacter coccineus]|uniref:Uncharacterized protein n=1 Tax=Hymenobacter coccineus TaxID=1908235 RepID=A0A1G1TBP7_9BACT|nr:hypothetical protein [Hymenobacter coccineus]OGX88289.1 hypothetical protein BEN49_10215 [Hymenobacter coccineus]